MNVIGGGFGRARIKNSAARLLRKLGFFYGPWPRQGNALSSNFPLESEAACFEQQSESQSVTVAAQNNGPLPSEAGPARRLIPLKLSLL
jgi:hypothetical protein